MLPEYENALICSRLLLLIMVGCCVVVLFLSTCVFFALMVMPVKLAGLACNEVKVLRYNT